MVLFGINFNAYYFILLKHFKEAFSMEEVRAYLLIIAGAVAVIFVNILHSCQSAFDALTKAFFQVASIITTTGFSTCDFDLWPTTSKLVLVLLMFIGACAGSTGGGIKVSRFLIVGKTVRKEFGSYVHPKSIKKIQMDGKPIEHDVVRSTNVYFMTYLMLFAAMLFLLSFEGMDLTSTFTAVAATFNNIGPGLGEVGPMYSFAGLTVFSKWVLSFAMLAGRLELFPLLMLFHPTVWKDGFFSRKD
jgi:trk system potassium uptake protein TrkH